MAHHPTRQYSLRQCSILDCFAIAENLRGTAGELPSSILQREPLARLGARCERCRSEAFAARQRHLHRPFANGSAEWRIGLAKQGRIGRFALGPQY
jgi:hypothetical protein